jgi:hypothetical protein
MLNQHAAIADVVVTWIAQYGWHTETLAQRVFRLKNEDGDWRVVRYIK